MSFGQERNGINSLQIELGNCGESDVWTLEEIGNYLNETGGIVPIDGAVAIQILDMLPSDRRMGIQTVIGDRTVKLVHSFDYGGAVFQDTKPDLKAPSLFIGPDTIQRRITLNK